MKAQLAPCPLCKSESIVSRHLVSTHQGDIPSHIYTCEVHGWFAIADTFHDKLNRELTETEKQRIEEVISDHYFPEDYWPASSLHVIDSF